MAEFPRWTYMPYGKGMGHPIAVHTQNTWECWLSHLTWSLLARLFLSCALSVLCCQKCVVYCAVVLQLTVVPQSCSSLGGCYTDEFRSCLWAVCLWLWENLWNQKWISFHTFATLLRVIMSESFYPPQNWTL